MTDRDPQVGELAPTAPTAPTTPTAPTFPTFPITPGDEPEIERRLLWAARMECLAALASGLTHSLSNLLASTLMSVEVVLRSNPASEQRQLLTSLQTMTREGLEMVRQVLWIARGVEGEPVVFQAQYLLVELQRLLASFMPAVPIITSYPQDLWPLAGDPHRFVQLVLALCQEASRGLPAGAALTLSAENVESTAGAAGGQPPPGAGRHILVQVMPRESRPAPDAGGHDGGERAGLAGERTAVAGERAGAAADRPAHRGRPAGLWIAERPSSPAAALAIAAGGSYEELSCAAGGGARIFLPASGLPTSSALPAEEPPPGAGSSVLIFEDEPLLAQALGEVLAGHGYRAAVAPRPGPPGAGPRQPAAGRSAGPAESADGRADILLAGAILDAEGRWQLAPAAAAAAAAVPIVLMIDAATAERLEREAPSRPRGFVPHAVLRKPFTARELLFALASGTRVADRPAIKTRG
jgi:CheY-like chemotaxis protein